MKEQEVLAGEVCIFSDDARSGPICCGSCGCFEWHSPHHARKGRKQYTLSALLLPRNNITELTTWRVQVSVETTKKSLHSLPPLARFKQT